MASDEKLVNFSDGEGLDEADIIRLQSYLWKQRTQGSANAGQAGNALALGHATVPGGDFSQFDPRVVPASALQTPAPYGFVGTLSMSGAGALSLAYGPQQILQGAGASTPGTLPAGFAIGDAISYTCDDDEIGISPLARPAANPRLDRLNIRLGFATGDAQNRDSEDAATRALTTLSVNKEQIFLLQQEVLSSAEAPTPTAPTPTAGYAKFLTAKRYVGEVALGTTFGDYRLETFPMNLKSETLYPEDAYQLLGAWTISEHEIAKNGTAAGRLSFRSRQMHAGCRLVGVEVAFASTWAIDVSCTLHRYQRNVAGGAKQAIQNIGSGLPIGGTANGVSFAGLADFDTPIWGNGESHGPLLSPMTPGNPADGLETSFLGLIIGDGAESIAASDAIGHVRFYYLE